MANLDILDMNAQRSNFRALNKSNALFRLFKVTTSTGENMISFAKEKLPGYKPKWGYGYYEFLNEEHIPFDQKVILMDSVSF